MENRLSNMSGRYMMQRRRSELRLGFFEIMWLEHGIESGNLGSNLILPLTDCVTLYRSLFSSGGNDKVQLITKRSCLVLTFIDNVLCPIEFSSGRPSTVAL